MLRRIDGLSGLSLRPGNAYFFPAIFLNHNSHFCSHAKPYLHSSKALILTFHSRYILHYGMLLRRLSGLWLLSSTATLPDTVTKSPLSQRQHPSTLSSLWSYLLRTTTAKTGQCHMSLPLLYWMSSTSSIHRQIPCERSSQSSLCK
jgi:hypothetical protein